MKQHLPVCISKVTGSFKRYSIVFYRKLTNTSSLPVMDIPPNPVDPFVHGILPSNESYTLPHYACPKCYGRRITYRKKRVVTKRQRDNSGVGKVTAAASYLTRKDVHPSKGTDTLRLTSEHQLMVPVSSVRVLSETCNVCNGRGIVPFAWWGYYRSTGGQEGLIRWEQSSSSLELKKDIVIDPSDERSTVHSPASVKKKIRSTHPSYDNPLSVQPSSPSLLVPLPPPPIMDRYRSFFTTRLPLQDTITTVPRPDNFIIGISGAGIAGLAVAIALLQRGFRNIHIYEKDTSFFERNQGYGLTMQQGSLALGCLGIKDTAFHGISSIAHYSFDAKGALLGCYGRSLYSADRRQYFASSGGSFIEGGRTGTEESLGIESVKSSSVTKRKVTPTSVEKVPQYLTTDPLGIAKTVTKKYITSSSQASFVNPLSIKQTVTMVSEIPPVVSSLSSSVTFSPSSSSSVVFPLSTVSSSLSASEPVSLSNFASSSSSSSSSSIASWSVVPSSVSSLSLSSSSPNEKASNESNIPSEGTETKRTLPLPSSGIAIRHKERHNIHLPRQALRKSLVDYLEKYGTNIIHWGTTIEAYEGITSGSSVGSDTIPSLTLTLSSGKKQSVNLLIGADGIHSKLRKQKINDPLNYLGVIVILGFTAIQHPLCSRRIFQSSDGITRLYTMPFSGLHTEYLQEYSRLDPMEYKEIVEYSTKVLSDIKESPIDYTMWQLSFPLREEEALTLAKQGSQALKEEALRRCGGWHNPIPVLLQSTETSSITGYPAYDRNIPEKNVFRTGAKGGVLHRGDQMDNRRKEWVSAAGIVTEEGIDGPERSGITHDSRRDGVLDTLDQRTAAIGNETKDKVSSTRAEELITLIGDAAHPMSPFKGQGANQALVDALHLARVLNDSTIGWSRRIRNNDPKKEEEEKEEEEGMEEKEKERMEGDGDHRISGQGRMDVGMSFPMNSSSTVYPSKPLSLPEALDHFESEMLDRVKDKVYESRNNVAILHTPETVLRTGNCVRSHAGQEEYMDRIRNSALTENEFTLAKQDIERMLRIASVIRT